MKLSIKHPVLSALAVVCAAIVAPTAAWAGTNAAAPAGLYDFSGSCGVGCLGSVSGTLNTTPGAASMIVTVLLSAPAATTFSAVASDSDAPSIVAVPVINFGPLVSYMLESDLKTSFVASNAYSFESSASGAWVLKFLNPIATLASSSPLSFSEINSPFASTTLASGTNLAFVRPPVPEPQTLLMLLAGLGIVGAAARRSQKQA